MESTAELIRRKDIIAITVTGCAKNSKLIQMINPSIVLIEEAAEVLESQLITILPPELKHLILIGVII